MKRELEAVIFDLDGVIVDTVEFYYLANKMIAEKLGITLTRAENDSFRGISSMAIIDELVRKANMELTAEEKSELRFKKNAFYQQLIENISPQYLLDGIRAFMVELVDNRIKIALASSSTNAKFVLERLGIIHYFDTIIDPTKLKNGKPDPEIFISAADMLQVRYENCAAIEDGEAGLRAILCTPMFSVSVGTADFLKNADWNVCCTKEITLDNLYSAFKKGTSRNEKK